MKHCFKDDSNCENCGCYGPNEEFLPCIEGKTIQGVINKDSDWEPMISIPISECEVLKEIEAMYKDLQN